MLHLEVVVSNAAELLDPAAYGTGALLRWESGNSQVGPFVEGGTVPLVAGTTVYNVWDPAGVVGTWYRTRVSNVGLTTASAYSDPFEGGVVTRYAELDDLLLHFETPPQAKRYARFLGLLDTATAEVTSQLNGRDFFRHPTTGSATWFASTSRTYRGRRPNDYGILHVHEGIVSLDTLEVSQDLGGSFTVVGSTNFVLRGANPDSSEPIPDGEPYFHVVFTGIGTVQGFPLGVNVIRLTGVRGWPAVPRDLREGIAQRARQLAYADPSYAGVVPGQSDYGSGVVSERWPQILYRFLDTERSRFFCHV